MRCILSKYKCPNFHVNNEYLLLVSMHGFFGASVPESGPYSTKSQLHILIKGIGGLAGWRVDGVDGRVCGWMDEWVGGCMGAWMVG